MIVMLVLVTTILRVGGSVVSIEGEGELLCGPRCVDFLLKFYGCESDLPGLAGEMDCKAGATLASVTAVLEKRGVHAVPTEISSHELLDWKCPVVVHLRPTLNAGDIGHYVVWLPSSDQRTTCFWDGVFGFTRMPTKEFCPLRSGYVILTSPKKGALKFEDVLSWGWIAAGASMILAVILGKLFCRHNANLAGMLQWLRLVRRT